MAILSTQSSKAINESLLTPDQEQKENDSISSTAIPLEKYCPKLYQVYLFEGTIEGFYRKMALQVQQLSLPLTERLEGLIQAVIRVASVVFSTSEVELLISTLKKSPILSTTEHFSSLTYSLQMNGGLSQAILRGFLGDKASIVFACATVKLEDGSYPKSLFFGKKKVSLLSNKFANTLAIKAPAAKMEKVSQELEGLKTQSKSTSAIDSAKQWLQDHQTRLSSLPTLWSQVSLFNKLYWESAICHEEQEHLPSSYFMLPLEEVVKEALIEELKKQTCSNWVISLILDENRRMRFARCLNGIRACWDIEKRKGTFLFWGVSPKGSPIPLFPEKEKLVSDDHRFTEVKICQETIAEMLKNGTLIPSAGLSVIYLSLYVGFSLLGGLYQVDYLTEIRAKILEEFGSDFEQADLKVLANIRTDYYLNLCYYENYGEGGLKRLSNKFKGTEIKKYRSLNHSHSVKSFLDRAIEVQRASKQ